MSTLWPHLWSSGAAMCGLPLLRKKQERRMEGVSELPAKPTQQDAQASSAQDQPGGVDPEAQQQRDARQTQRPGPAVQQSGAAQGEGHGSHQGYGGSIHAIQEGRGQ